MSNGLNDTKRYRWSRRHVIEIITFHINKMGFTIIMLANLITMIESVIDMAHFGLWPNFYLKTSIEWLFVKVPLSKLISNALYEHFFLRFDKCERRSQEQQQWQHAATSFNKWMFKQFWILTRWTSHFHIICLPNRTVWPKLHWSFVAGMEINFVVNIMWHTFQANLLQIALWLWRFHLAIRTL